jgi:hypothetical protein
LDYHFCCGIFAIAQLASSVNFVAESANVKPEKLQALMHPSSSLRARVTFAKTTSASGSLPTLKAKAAFDSLNVRFREVEARFVHVRQREPTSLRIGHFGLPAVIQ